MTIRDASPSDAEAIHDVARASWEVDYPDILSRETVETGVEEWYAVDSLRDTLTDSQIRLLVAIESDAVVGFAHTILNDEDEGDILRLYVHPDHRRQGIGRTLLERTCDELFDAGVDVIYAMVLADNDPGNAFYRDLGFEKASEAETTIGGNSFRENTFVLARQ